ncbi:MAG: pitrilysin family protein [Bacillota bacterium]
MINRTVLGNGLTIISEEMDHVRSAALGVWVLTGARHEGPGESGITHFIEHMLFKGTVRRTAREIAEAVDGVGGQINAFTAKEYCCFYARVMDEHLDLVTEILGDMVNHPLFADEEVLREVRVVGEEISMYLDAPDEYVHELFSEGLWGQHPLGNNILGDRQVIQNLSRQKVVDYYQRHFTAGNILVTAAGRLSHQRLVENIATHFGQLNGAAVARPRGQRPGRVRVMAVERGIEQVHLCLGSWAIPQDHPDLYNMHVLMTVLGGGSSSRLFQEIRENRGLAYSVYAFPALYGDDGCYTIYAGLAPGNLAEVCRIISDELIRLAESPLDEATLGRAREQLKGNLMLGLEGTSSRMSRLARCEIYFGRHLTLEETVDGVDAVTAGDVQRLAGRLFLGQPQAVAAVGPLTEEEAFQAVAPIVERGEAQ